MFRNTIVPRIIFFSLGGLLIFSLAACSSEPEPSQDQAESAVEAAPRDMPAETRRTSRAERAQTMPGSTNPNHYRFVPDVEGQLESDGMGLHATVDGFSAETFNDSLAWIATDVSAEQYTLLERSIRFLNNSDPRFLGNDERMREGLNGMTGEEIIDLADQVNRDRMGDRYNPQ